MKMRPRRDESDKHKSDCRANDGCIASPVDPLHYKPSSMIATSITTSTTPATEITATELHSQSQLEGEKVNYDVADLYKAICENKWSNVAKAFVEENPSVMGEKITTFGQTAVHVAASLGHVRMVEELVALMAPQYLEIVDVDGFTPLATAAAYSGQPRLAQCMVNKNSKILYIATSKGILPVTLAVSTGHIEMGRYLYSLTPLEPLIPKNGNHGVKLLYWCFNLGELGVALDLLQKCQELVLAEDDDGTIPIMKIAGMPSAFSNGSHLVFWKQWIYKYLCIRSTTNTNSVHLNIQHKDDSELVRGDSLLSRFMSKAYNMLGVKEIYEMKLVHAQATQILSLLCENISFLGSDKIKERNAVFSGLFCAAKEGNVEFVEKVSKVNPQLIPLVTQNQQWNIFFNAIEFRQAEVFTLIHGLRSKDGLAARIDVSGNTMLHVVANLAPSSKLNRISGPAFQMQSELQWFKEVESVVPQGYRVYQNFAGMQPKDVFKENHKGLRKEGEEWMKETASSCSVVAALVVTIMFATAFTVPGGNNQDFGYPIFLEKKLFILFLIADALSLFSSTTSVLMFLGILTSRYAEEDFLRSLPTKLIIGLSTLFLSIATMMIAFSATILLMLQHNSHSWVYLPIIMLASVPVTLFVLLQFPLLVQMISSTYGPGMFKRNVKPWL